MKRGLKYFVSVFVLVVFTLYLVPHEVVHVFYDHHDTEHQAHGSGPELSTIHVHCDFLCNYSSDFLAADELFIPQTSCSLLFYFQKPEVDAGAAVALNNDSRGPPLS